MQVAIAAIDAGAKIIELGVPFSDPVADGPVIQRASEVAIGNRTSLTDVIGLARDLRNTRPRAGLILFSYLNPVLRYGLERFAADARDAALDGVLITDLALEESSEYRKLMREHGLATVFLIAPTSPEERIRKIAQASTGFIYAVSRTGVTGTQQASDLQGEVKRLVRRIKKHSQLPVAVGFGISSAQQLHAVGEYADAAVVGSAIVKLMEEHPGREAEAVSDWLKSLQQDNARPKASAR
jgi:tryptophan synthase alpha chain